MCIGLGSLLGSSLAGILWGIDPRLTFFYGAALAGMSVALLALSQIFWYNRAE
jgi:hypothetical protein